MAKKQYAGKAKVSKDIDRKLKAEATRKKANEKKAKQAEVNYYARLLAKNKKKTDGA